MAHTRCLIAEWRLAADVPSSMQVAKSVKIVLKSSQPYIVVVLDMERIEALHMRISSYSVQQSIVDHPKLKLKHEVSIALTSGSHYGSV